MTADEQAAAGCAVERHPDLWKGPHAGGVEVYPVSGRRLLAEDDQPAETGSWSPSLPPAPSGFLDRANFTLTEREAKYLAERIWELGQTVFGELLSSSDAEIDSDFVWETTFAARPGSSLKSQIAHAQNFSELMHGAALLYNFMLACDAKRHTLTGHAQAVAFLSHGAGSCARHPITPSGQVCHQLTSVKPNNPTKQPNLSASF